MHRRPGSVPFPGPDSRAQEGRRLPPVLSPPCVLELCSALSFLFPLLPVCSLILCLLCRAPCAESHSGFRPAVARLALGAESQGPEQVPGRVLIRPAVRRVLPAHQIRQHSMALSMLAWRCRYSAVGSFFLGSGVSSGILRISTAVKISEMF